MQIPVDANIVDSTAPVTQDDTYYCVFVEGLGMMGYNLDYAMAASFRDSFIRQGHAHVALFRVDEAEALEKNGFSQRPTVIEEVKVLSAPKESNV